MSSLLVNRLAKRRKVITLNEMKVYKSCNVCLSIQ
jgi:hypothetical protein